jgi:ribosomal protein S18 acetylase RimI-like enzyme
MTSQQKTRIRAMLFRDCFSGELARQADVSLDGECWALSEETGSSTQFAAVLFAEGNFIFNVCTAKTARGQGWMKRLFTAFLVAWRTQHPRRKVLRLSVWQANAPAIALYRQLGFVAEKEIVVRNDVSGTDDATWTMALRIHTKKTHSLGARSH